MIGQLVPEVVILRGSIRSTGCLSGNIVSKVVLKGCAYIPEIVDNTTIEEYDGTYVVTPIFDDQVLPTADKLLVNDLTIESIPYSEVTNDSGGLTINIGG